MVNLLLLFPLVGLLLAPFKMRHSKYFMVLLGVLIFSVTFFLRANHLLDAGSKIGNFALATGIFIFCGVLYTWYFERIVRSKRL
jgi:hypothetical protein